MNPKTHIGDGKLPNHYWVFQYDQKYKHVKNEDGSYTLEIIAEDTSKGSHLLGEFRTYKAALQCVDNKAYLPNVVIEDRLTGQVFEQLCIVCQECERESYETHQDVRFSKEKIEQAGGVFE